MSASNVQAVWKTRYQERLKGNTVPTIQNSFVLVDIDDGMITKTGRFEEAIRLVSRYHAMENDGMAQFWLPSCLYTAPQNLWPKALWVMDRIFDLRNEEFKYFVKSYNHDCTKDENIVYVRGQMYGKMTGNVKINYRFDFEVGKTCQDDFESDKFRVGIVLNKIGQPDIIKGADYRPGGEAVFNCIFIGLDPMGLSVCLGEKGAGREYIRDAFLVSANHRSLASLLNNVGTKVCFTLKKGYLVDVYINNQKFAHLDARRYIYQGHWHSNHGQSLDHWHPYGFIKFESAGRHDIITSNHPLREKDEEDGSRAINEIHEIEGRFCVMNLAYSKFGAKQEMDILQTLYMTVQNMMRENNLINLDEESRAFYSALKTLVCAPGLEREHGGVTFYTRDECNKVNYLAVTRNTFPAVDLNEDIKKKIFESTKNFRFFVHQVALFTRICRDRHIIHGDFYSRNVHFCPNTLCMTVIDFERGEVVVDPKRLARKWIGALAGFFLEFLYLGAKVKALEKRKVYHLMRHIECLFRSQLRVTNFVEFDENNNTVSPNFRDLFRKWVLTSTELAFVHKYGPESLFDRLNGSNHIVSNTVLDNITDPVSTLDNIIAGLTDL